MLLQNKFEWETVLGMYVKKRQTQWMKRLLTVNVLKNLIDNVN